MNKLMKNNHEKNWERWLYSRLFEQVPCNIAIIDRNFTIVENNHNFLNLFGDGRTKKCYQIYKQREKQCPECAAYKTFLDGKTRVNEEVGLDKNGRDVYYIVHIAPIFDEEGNIPFVIEMSTDVTETKRLHREYQVLFERVPCYVTILNKDLRVVRANERFCNTFGDPKGKKCFEIYKKKTDKCLKCPAEKTFSDGKVHTEHQKGITKYGKITHYMVTTSPLTKDEYPVSNVIEISLDVSEVHELENELQSSQLFREKIIENAAYALISFDQQGNIFSFNPAAETLLKFNEKELIGKPPPDDLFPQNFNQSKNCRNKTFSQEMNLIAKDGENIPVFMSCFELKNDELMLGQAVIIQDLRMIKKLQHEKVDAERLAAVGQTVASLAHGIKNILMGLEGGMYIMDSGITKGKLERINQGWKILERNIGKISDLAKNLLNFSKGRPIKTEIVNPNKIVSEVYVLFHDTAEKENISLRMLTDDSMIDVPFDSMALHTCLANLISNALDACKMSEKDGCTVLIRCFQQNNEIVFEVSDEGCGMDYEVKQKVFTNFFSTKGSNGTGLGLLTTRKIVQEHGGRIEFESNPGKGASFFLHFPINRLQVVE